MNKPIKDRTGQRGSPILSCLSGKRDLGGDHGGSEIVAVFKNFEEILAVIGGHGRKESPQ